MPVAGDNRKGFWFEIRDGVLHKEQRETYSMVCVKDVDEAAQQILAGERVHVWSTYPTPDRVRQAVQAAMNGA